MTDLTIIPSSQVLANVGAQFDIVDKLLRPRQQFWKEILDELKEAKQWQALLLMAERAIKELPTWAYGYFRRGTAHYDLKNYKKAIENCTKAIELDEKFVWAYNTRGNAKSELKDYEGAIVDYLKAIELEKEYENKWFDVAICYEHLDNYKEALNYYDRYLQKYPKDVSAKNTRNLLKYIGITSKLKDTASNGSHDKDLKVFRVLAEILEQEDRDLFQISGKKDVLIFVPIKDTKTKSGKLWPKGHYIIVEEV